MELAEGEDLSARVARGPLGPQRALAVACQIALALEAAHETGLVHRDLKPANIKISDEDQIKVLDFGLAKMVADDTAAGTVALGDSPTITSDMTRTGVIMGTAAYMSPEQTRGKAIDKRTDIWAFGCVLYEMLTGKPAFPGETLSDTLAAILKTEPDWDRLPDDLHPAVTRLLQRCLKKNPRQRLHDIADGRIVLEDVISGADPGGGITVGSGKPQRGLPWWLGLVGLLAIVGLSAKLFLGEPAASMSPVRLATLTFSGSDWSPDASPDGELVAFTSIRDGIPRIWMKQLASGSEVPITDGSDDLARFSPDGSQILFVHDEANTRHLYRIPVLGGQPRKVMDNVTEADWSPDGTRVAFLRMSLGTATNEFAVGIADIQTGVETILATVENRLCYGVRWSPNGDSLLMVEGSLSGNMVAAEQLDLIDTETGVIRHLPNTPLAGSFTAPDWAPGGTSFLVGQTEEFLSHITGRPGLILEYYLETETTRPLFWSRFRSPQGGWGFGTIAVLNERQVVVDGFERNAILQEFAWPDAETGTGGSPARVLTTSIGFDRQPVYSPDGKHVLFSSNRSGNIDLWLVERATGELRQVTDDPAHDWDPAFSPDNKFILWSSNRGGHMEIWMSNLDGSGARQVTQDGKDAENPTMTPDGAWIIYASANDEKIGLWKIRPDGTEATRLHAGTDLIPEVSPDGRYALFSVIRSLDYVIKVVDITSGEVVPFEIELTLTQRNQDVVYGRARWTPAGRQIVYVGQGSDGSSGIYVQDFVPGQDTRASRRPVAGFSKQYSSESLGVAPDGKSFVVSTIYNRQTLQMADLLDLENWR
jgi:Tol biopolymer transport system component